MSNEIKIGSPHLTIHHGHAVMVSEPDGMMERPSQKGLFFRDTRLISDWRAAIEDAPWKLLNSTNESYCGARMVLTNPALRTTQGELKQHTIGLTISRCIDGGLHEDLDIANYGMEPCRFNLAITIGSDFADFFEVKASRTFERDGIATTWSEGDQTLTNLYRCDGFSRGVTVRINKGQSRASFANGKIVFPIALAPGGRWHACLMHAFIDCGERLDAPASCYGQNPKARIPTSGDASNCQIAHLESSCDEFNRLSRQAISDMNALELQLPAQGKPIIAAGVPWFLSLFGRDSIIASLQYRLVDPDSARGVLDRLGALQADGLDDYRDAEPGKIPHELRHGELAFFRKIPHTPYYGTADATPLYLILLHATWKCTGDDDLIHRHLPTAKRCLDWIDRYGDRDGDGFQEYQTRSPAGYENQSWKDAGDAILYPEGTCVKGPKALCELQGYVFNAWLGMAEIFAALGEAGRAADLEDKADDLYRRFNEAFWNEQEGFYALALDGDKKPVMTVASNPGHCLWSGIVPRERAGRVVARLMQPDLWSGWGIRTLSSGHPAFNPFSYQNGSVWPHDNSIIAMGMKRYGFAKEAATVGRAICEAATFFMSSRLPELFAGIDRDEIGFPLRYLGANVPQAWATGAIFAIVQMLIGFQPDAPANALALDPMLPDWLPDLKIRDLRLGNRRIDLAFKREGETTLFAVTKGDPARIERRAMSVPGDRPSKREIAGAAVAAQ